MFGSGEGSLGDGICVACNVGIRPQERYEKHCAHLWIDSCRLRRPADAPFRSVLWMGPREGERQVSIEVVEIESLGQIRLDTLDSWCLHSTRPFRYSAGQRLDH